MDNLRYDMCDKKGQYSQQYAKRKVLASLLLKGYYKCPFCIRYHVSSKKPHYHSGQNNSVYQSRTLERAQAYYHRLLQNGAMGNNILLKKVKGEYFIVVR